VLPKEIRDALGIKPGQKVMLKVVKDHAEIIPLPADLVKGFCGIFEKDSSLTKSLIKGRKEEARLNKDCLTLMPCWRTARRSSTTRGS